MKHFNVQLMAGFPVQINSHDLQSFSWVGFGIAMVPVLGFLALVVYFFWRRWKEEATTREIEKREEEELDRILAGDPKIAKERSQTILVSLLRDRRRGVRSKAATALRDGAGEKVPRLVAEQMKQGYYPERIAEAIGDTGWAAMEPSLLPLLEGKKKIALAAMEALGRIGGEAALAILQARDHRPELREARTTAIARIKERLAPRRAGEVSLVQGEAGQVSLPPE